MAGGEILANIVLSGDESAARGFDNVGDEMEESAASAGILSAGLGRVASQLSDTIAPARLAASSIDEAGDEAQQAGTQAAMASGNAGLFSTALLGMGTAGALASSSLSGVAVSIGAVTLALAPLLPALGLAVGALGGLAAAFGAILGSGLLAFNEQTKGLKKTLADLKSQLKPLIVQFGSQFVPLIKDGLNAIVPFAKSLLDAVGNLTPFVSALRALGGAAMQIIPQLLSMFVSVARQALPAFTKLGNFISANLVPALSALFAAGQRAAGPVTRVAMAIVGFGQSLMGVAGWVGRFAVSLYNLAGAAAGIGNLNKALSRVGLVLQQGVRGAFQWLRSTGIPLAKQAFSLLSSAALTAFQFGREQIVPAIKTGLSMAWSWVRGPGVALAKSALSFLATQALNALQFGREQIVPKIKTGLQMAWNWVRGPGVSLAKSALSFLATQALRALKFGREQIVPKIKTGLGKAWTWVRGPGVTAAKNALTFLATQALNALKFGREKIVPKIKTGLGKAWTWVRGPGVTAAKNALSFLATQALKALKFGREQIVPKIRTAINSAVSWLKNRGLSLFGAAFRSIGRHIGKVITGHLKKLPQYYKKFIPLVRNWLRSNGTRIIRKGFEAIGKGIRAAVMALVTGPALLLTAFGNVIQGIYNWLVSGGLTQIKNAFIRIGTGIASYIRGPMVGDIIGAVQFLVQGFLAAVQGLYDGLIGHSLIPEMFRAIASFIRGFDLFSAVDSLLSSAWRRFNKFGTDILNTITNALADIVSDIRSWNLFSAVDSVLSGVWKRFNKFKTDIINTLSNAASQAVGAFNNAMPDSLSIPEFTIGGGKGISWDPVKVAGQTVVPGGSWTPPSVTLGGGSINIPKLASGGIATSSTLAMIGEGSEDEAVLPLSKLEGMLSTASARRSGTAGGGGTVVIDQTIESGAFQGVGLDEVRDLATQTFDDWMDQIKREIQAQRTI